MKIMLLLSPCWGGSEPRFSLRYYIISACCHERPAAPTCLGLIYPMEHVTSTVLFFRSDYHVNKSGYSPSCVPLLFLKGVFQSFYIDFSCVTAWLKLECEHNRTGDHFVITPKMNHKSGFLNKHTPLWLAGLVIMSEPEPTSVCTKTSDWLTVI